MNNEKALKITEVAEILSVHRQTVWNLIKQGKIKSVNVSPGRKAVWPSDLKNYIKSINNG